MRPRNQVLADEAVIFISGVANRCNFAVQPFNPDYGLDLLMMTVGENSLIENGWIYVQSKGTEAARRLADGRIPFRMEAKHAAYYLREAYPIILVVYEARHRRAYWLHTQPHIRGLHLNLGTRTYLTVYLDPANTLNEAAFEQIRQLKNGVQAQVVGAGIADA